MNHSGFNRQLYLLATGDIEPDARRSLEEHLRACDECRTELQRLTKLHAIVGKRHSVEVNDQLLAEARMQLRTALRAEVSKLTVWRKAGEVLESLFSPPVRMALGATAVLAVGILVGRALSPSTGSLPQSALSSQTGTADTRITNVRVLRSGTGGDDVEFTFDAVTPVRMKGSLDDPRIQKVLAHAMLNEDNPGVRLRAVSVTRPLKTASADREVKAALILALQSDENAGVRKEALIALQRYPFDGEIKDAFLHTLMYDKNPGLRIAAINGLDSLGVSKGGVDANLLTILKEKSETDDNNYIRLKAKAVLQEVRQ